MFVSNVMATHIFRSGLKFGVFCAWMGSPIGLLAQTVLTLDVGSWPPYIDFASSHKGVLTQTVQSAFSTTGAETKLRETSWKAAENQIDQAQAISFGWIKNPERVAKWLFSDPVCDTSTVLVVRKSNQPVWSKLEHLVSYRLGWSRGYSYGEAIDRLRPNLQVIEMVNDEVALKRLADGSVDAVPMDPLVAKELIRKLFSAQEAQNLLIDTAPQHVIARTSLHLVCSMTAGHCKTTIGLFNLGLKQHYKQSAVPMCGDQ